jgi:Ca-activated chloride channel family protein
MDYFFRFEHPWLLGITALCVAATIVLRYFFSKTVIVTYPLAHTLRIKKHASTHFYRTFFYVLRLITVSILALLVAKPQLVDSRSNIVIEGIDIMIVLDASGSMQLCDDNNDPRARFDVAKEEAMRFIQKRTNDALGLVIFGKDAVSRCPLTMDKKIVMEMVDTLKLGDIDPDGTVLATAMVAAVNRLKHATGATKVIILLTDGTPSDGDMDCSMALAIVKKFGIKVYTIGIGNEKDEIFFHPLRGIVQKQKVNAPLLQRIARDSGGRFLWPIMRVTCVLFMIRLISWKKQNMKHRYTRAMLISLCRSLRCVLGC